MKKILLWILVWIPALTLNGQDIVTEKTADPKTLKWFQQAVRYSFNGEYQNALKELEKVLEEEPRFIDAHLQQAAIFYDMGLLDQAEKGFEKALELKADYDHRIFYQLAMTEYRQDKYSESAGHFQQFLDRETKDSRWKERASQYLINARFAADAIADPAPFNPQPLSENINTPGSEYLPSLTADGAYLVYTAVVNGQEDFYMSRKIDGEWQKGEPIAAINTRDNEGAQSISADGHLMVFTACNRREGLGSCDLYFSASRNGQWATPRNIGPPINSGAWESQPALSANREALYFASNREGGKGGKDIWVSYRLPDGRWSAPKGIGNAINTPADEEAPFIHPDGQTLYFMSNGHPGMGGSDLYLSRKDAQGQWTTPVNLGYPINTKGNEGALIVSLDGSTAFFASDQNAPEGGRKTTDIFSFVLPVESRPSPVTYVQGKVFDVETMQTLEATVEIIDLETSAVFASIQTTDDGSFLLCMPLGKDYALNVSREAYLFYSDNFALSETTTLQAPFLLEAGLVPLTGEAGAESLPAESRPIVLKNVFFETGSAVLKPASKTELTRLKRLLEENPGLRIQINGHTDNVGSEETNLVLSVDRAKAVYDFLIANRIDPERLRYEGFGESRPIDTNDTPEGRQRNRRTEFEVLSQQR